MATQEKGAGNSARQLLRLLSPASPTRLAIPQVRYLGRLYAAFRWGAGFGVVALIGLLTPPTNHVWLALLIVWVALYNVPITIALNRMDNESIRAVVRAAAIVDGVSYFALLAIYAPATPAVLIALFPCILIELVTFDGAIGGIYGVLMFIAGFSALELVQRTPSWVEVILWSAVMAITASSLTLSSQVMLGAASAQVLGGAPPARPAATPGAPRLSAREQEVLRLVAAGYSNVMIASRLNLSENTIKGHVESLLTHLNARNRAEAVAAAGRLDLL